MNSPFEYQESLNSLHFTEEQKAAIARRAAEAARKQTRRRPPPSRPPDGPRSPLRRCWCWRWAPPAPPASCGPLWRSSLPSSAAAPAQTEIIDKIGYPVGAS